MLLELKTGNEENIKAISELRNLIFMKNFTILNINPEIY